MQRPMRLTFAPRSGFILDRRFRRTISLAEGLEPRVLLSATLVQDLNPGTLGSNLSPVFALGSHNFFYTNYPASSSASPQLWETDGTDAGTVPATDLATKLGAGVVSDPTAFAGSTWFLDGGRLWKSDGTAVGTSALPNLQPAAIEGIVANKLIIENEFVGLVAVDSAGQASTLRDTPDNYGAFAVSADGSTMYFIRDALQEQELWFTDGTAAGTHLIKAGFDTSRVLLAPGSSGGVYLFDTGTGPQHGLWRSDGSPAGTTLISAISGADNNQLALVGSTVFFTGRDDAHGTALWKSDGTPGGTSLVKQLDPADFSSVNGVLLFYASDADPQLSGLWRSDGTPDGTFLLQHFAFPVPQQPPVVSGNSIYFAQYDGIHGTQLWKCDGTTAGTQIVGPINPFGSANPQQISAANGELYLTADDGVHGPELWTSDGTSAGTRLVKDINTQPASSNPSDIVQFNGKAYFEAVDSRGPELWSSDGTAKGTAPVTNFGESETWGHGPGAFLGNLTVVNGALYFTTAAGNLWKTDGAAAGTLELFSPKTVTSQQAYPANLTAVGNTLLFTSGTVQDGFALTTELWKTDGTAAGTTRLETWPVSPNLLPAFRSTVLGNRMIFQVMNGDQLQLWRSDGTAAGTAMIKNFAPPGTPVNNNPDLLFSWGVVGPDLYFIESQHYTDAAGSYVTVHDLWKTDGTPAGTVLVTPNFAYNPERFIDLGGNGYFFSATPNGAGLYRLDSSAAGASLVTSVAASAFGLDRTPGVMLDGKLYFVGLGTRLFRSDGTAGGTQSVINLSQTAAHSVGPLSGLTAANGMLYVFSYSYNQSGNVSAAELWQSDGTAAGTIPVVGISPGPQTAATNTGILEGPPTLAGNRLFFSANDGVHGDELWAADASVAGSVFVDSNHNGVRDIGEHAFSGVTVYIDVNNNGKLDAGELSTVTDANGNYVFDGLAPGSYLIRQVIPAGYSQTTAPFTSPAAAASIGATTAGPIFGDVLVSSVPLDFSMLLNLAQHYGQSGTFSQGDLNGDGVINFDDLLLLAQNYTGASATARASI